MSREHDIEMIAEKHVLQSINADIELIAEKHVLQSINADIW